MSFSDEDEEWDDPKQETPLPLRGVKQESEQDEEDEDEEDEEYIVESIKSHKWFPHEKAYKYLVKWEGYEDPSDETWEPWSSLSDVQVAQAYLKRIGGMPDPPGTGRKSPAKRARESEGMRKAPPSKKSRGSEERTGDELQNAARADHEGESEEDDVLFVSIKATPGKKQKQRYPPPVSQARPASRWDSQIAEIFTIEERTNSATGRVERYGIVIWQDGESKTRHRLGTLHEQAPQAMLRFYSKNLRISYTSRPETDDDKDDEEEEEEEEEEEDSDDDELP